MTHRAILAASLAVAAHTFAQTPTPPAPPANGDAVVNGNFAKFAAQQNLWDGVDAKNLLTGNAVATYAVTENGKVGSLQMPISVHFADMNGDRLPDIVSCDPTGIVRVYFNSGTPAEPKFTTAEVMPIFPPQVAKDERWENQGWWTWPHSIPKLTLFDWRKRGTPDLVFGNYTGDICMIDNTGTPREPVFPQPHKYERVRVHVGAKPWGNLFAPCVVDWNKDGKPDLLIGEGSYSANSVFVLLNQGSASEPKFTDDQRFYLCYGDGREQLVPTVADFNGDGEPDVAIGDRQGTVGLHLNLGKWKPGTELPLAQMVTFGGAASVGTGVAPHACDYNGDGLIDLLLGKADGHIAMALNIGTKTEPKFGPATDIPGVNLWDNDVRIPAIWTVDPGANRGNLYAYTSVQDTKSPGGGNVLKSGFYPSPNKVIKMVPLMVDGADSVDFFRYWWDQWYPMKANWAAGVRATNSFVIRQDLLPLKVGGNYTLSFAMKGAGIHDGQATVAFLGANENTPTKFAVAGRGMKAVKDEAHEEIYEVEKFSNSAQWKTVKKSFTVRFKDKTIKSLAATTLAILEFKFELDQYSGSCEIGDVQLKVAE
ncbi:MAG: VCBS repeat-containing protein [Chthoniobacteraceae bacterium]